MQSETPLKMKGLQLKMWGVGDHHIIEGEAMAIWSPLPHFKEWVTTTTFKEKGNHLMPIVPLPSLDGVVAICSLSVVAAGWSFFCCLLFF